MKLSIIIINYNGGTYIQACLDSLFASGIKDPFEVIVFDNHSEDRSIETLRQYGSKITLIENKENIGFSRGNNACLPYCSGELLLLLNNDTYIKKGAIQSMIDYYEKTSQIGALSPKLLNEDGSIQIQGSSLGAWRFKSKNPRKVPFICGAALMISKTLYNEIGGLDENVFFYNDDIILCKELKKRQKDIHYLPSAEVIHYGGLSTKTRKKHCIIDGYKGSLYISYRFYPKVIHYLHRLVLLLDLIPRILITGLFTLFKRENLDHLRAYMIVLRVNLCGNFMPENINERKKEC